MKKLMDKIGFSENKTLIGFLTVVTAGQLIYSSFEAFKGTFYNLLLDVLNLTNAELGTIFSLIGISMFLYIPGGWINNRFSTKSILIFGLLIRFITMNIVVLASPSYEVLRWIAISWGIVDAFFWPAVLNGVILFTNEKNRSIGFGLLESIRRTEEVVMNLILVAVMSFFGGIAVFKGGMFIYNLLILPLVWLIIKYVPKNGIAAEEETTTETTEEKNKSLDALQGLIHVMLKPQIWLAAISAMAVYWCYIILIYTVPYLQSVFGLSTSQTAMFGIFNTGIMGIIAGVIAGTIADFFFKSSVKMMAVSLSLSALILFFILSVPNNQSFLLLSVVLLFLFSFTTFLSKSIILAPIAEVKIPSKYSGSAMSVGSFLAYAPVFWVYKMNGNILDANTSNPAIAYESIFKIGITVALVGAACSFLQVFLNKRTAKKNIA